MSNKHNIQDAESWSDLNTFILRKDDVSSVVAGALRLHAEATERAAERIVDEIRDLKRVMGSR